MDFALTEEQTLIQQTVKEFVQDQEKESVEKVFRGLAELDFMGIFVPEKYSGAECDFVSYTLAVEELAKVSASVALGYAIHSTQAAYALLKWGSDTLKEKYLIALSKGDKIGSYAYGETGESEDLLLLNTVAEKKEDGYCLNGKKTFVINGDIADLYIVFAKTEDKLSAFVVEKEMAGVSFGTPYTKMGLDGLTAATMCLDNVYVSAKNILGEEGCGEEIAQAVQELYSISLAAIAMGIAENAKIKCISYGKQRVQFKQPIISFDALREMIGNMAITIEAARLLTYKAAFEKDQNKAFGETARMARCFAVKTGETSCRNAIQFHGGYGYTKDLGVEVLLRDIKGLSVIETLKKPLVLAVADDEID